jgi:hypothetical protein
MSPELSPTLSKTLNFNGPLASLTMVTKVHQTEVKGFIPPDLLSI